MLRKEKTSVLLRQNGKKGKMFINSSFSDGILLKEEHYSEKSIDTTQIIREE